jgi:hypothetical protein
MNRVRKNSNTDWNVGSVFGIEQNDQNYSLGQVLDIMMPNVVSCSFYDVRYRTGITPSDPELPFNKLVAAISTTREKLDRGQWRLISSSSIKLERQFWPNESLRDLGWVGAKTYGSRIVEKFLDAYFGLAPWDCYADPSYFDKLLFYPSRKPKHLKFKTQF